MATGVTVKTSAAVGRIAGLVVLLAGCYSGAAPRAMTVEDSFSLYKKAIATDDSKTIVSCLSLKTLDSFEKSRKLALYPDDAQYEVLSQYEVLIGFQALWLLGKEKLKTMSSGDLAMWASEKDLLPLQELASVNARDIRVKGEQATAFMERDGVVMTNSVLFFVLAGGQWRLDVGGLLAEGEKPLAELRSKTGLSKAELAVASLENRYQQAIPVLRQLLQSPYVRQRLAEWKEANPSNLYDGVVRELSLGRQRDAEDLLEVLVGIHTNDQRLVFVQAACKRSRFNKAAADALFAQVLAMDPRTPEGACSRVMLEMDEFRSLDQNFEALQMIREKDARNPFFHWLYAIQCRDYYKRSGSTSRSRDGCVAFKQALRLFEKGPCLIHQTYGNILSDELNEHEAALKFRKTAVDMEPSPWTYQGLGNTLYKMGRFEEADQAYAKMVEFNPDNPEYYFSWIQSMEKRGDWKQCIEKSKALLQKNPGFYKAHLEWGVALDRLGQHQEALIHFEEAIRLNPAYALAYKDAACVLKKMGEDEKADRYLEKANRLGLKDE